MTIRMPLSAAGVTYNLLLTNKFNVIVGCSGSGKTRLAHFAEIILDNNIPQVAGVPEVIGDQNNLERNMRFKTGAIFVVDEATISRSGWHDMLRLMVKSSNYFILCTREGNPSIPYGVESTFELVGGPDVYTMIPHYRRTVCSRTCNGARGVLCEDSSLGEEYLHKACTVLPVSAAAGRSTLCNKLHALPERQVVVFDKCGIGSAMDELISAAHAERAMLFDTRSFEYEVLSALFFNYFTEYGTGDDHLKYSSEEAYYVATLNSVLQSLFHIGYSKNALPLVKLFLEKKAVISGRFCDISQLSREDTVPYEEILEEDKRQGGSSNESDEP